MRILYFDLNMPYLLKDMDYPVGGATVELYAWIKGFQANRHKVGVVAFRGAKEYIDKPLEFDIVETYGLDEGIPKLRWIYKKYPAMLKAVREYKPDFLVQECAGYGTGLMAFIGNKLNIPFVYRVGNDMDTDERYKVRLGRFEQVLYEYGLKHASAIVCQNKYQYDCLKKKYPSKKLVIIHNPYYYSDEPTEIKKYSERKYIAWLGIFQHQKNLPVLCDIVKKLPSLEFSIAGKPLNQNLDEQTRSALIYLENCKNVEFVGYLKRKDVISFLSEAYALLNTSHYEGFSNTFLESFFAGTPIVTTSKVDPDDIIDKYSLGRAVKSDGELATALALLINQDEDEYNSIARRCRAYVIEKHDPGYLARKFMATL